MGGSGEWNRQAEQQKKIERLGWQCLRCDAFWLLSDFFGTLQHVQLFPTAAGVRRGDAPTQEPMPAEHGPPEPALLPSLSMDMGATVQEEEESEEDGPDLLVPAGDTGILFHSTVDPAPIHTATHKKAGTVDEPHFFSCNVEKNIDTLLLHPCAPEQYEKRTKKDKGRETTSTPSVQPSCSHARRNGRIFY